MTIHKNISRFYATYFKLDKFQIGQTNRIKIPGIKRKQSISKFLKNLANMATIRNSKFL